MVELVKYVVDTFAEFPEQAEYDVKENGNSVVIILSLVESDMGKVIGRQGKLAKAIRTLIKLGGQRQGKKVTLEIKEKV